jgi:hypothetical protein
MSVNIHHCGHVKPLTFIIVTSDSLNMQ